VALCVWAGGLTAVPIAAEVAARGASPPSGLDVLPFPGTPDASAQTQISFPSIRPSALRAVNVIGSRSGLHEGRLRPLMGGGSSFTPRHAFVPGEQVTVRATMRAPVPAINGSAPTIDFSFGVAVPAPVPAARTQLRHDIRDSNGFTHSYNSSPALHAPLVSRTGKDPDPSAGDIFVDAQNSIAAGPVILDPTGNLVWFKPMHHSAAFNVEVQQYQGVSVLTYWQGYVVAPGYGIGSGVIVNHLYQTIHEVNAGNGYHADLHEFQITPQGNALITIYAPVKANLQSIGGPRKGTLLDSIIQEINIETGQVLWEWHASGHVPLTSSYAGRPTAAPYDFFHANSIEQLPNGDLLVSSRATWAVYDINMRTGRIRWILGGKRSSFRIGTGANFEWQHDAHLQGSTLTVFDNAAGGGQVSEPASRALQISVNFNARRATLQRASLSKPSVVSSSQGSVQQLSDGNAFVGWGQAPYFTEYGRGGRQLFSFHFHSPPLQSYRAYRFPWWGQPTIPPSLAVSATSSGATAYASWNGATTVASWVLLAGPDPTTMQPVATAPKTSFETALTTSNTGPSFAVEALDSSGHPLAISNPVQR